MNAHRARRYFERLATKHAARAVSLVKEAADETDPEIKRGLLALVVNENDLARDFAKRAKDVK